MDSHSKVPLVRGDSVGAKMKSCFQSQNHLASNLQPQNRWNCFLTFLDKLSQSIIRLLLSLCFLYYTDIVEPFSLVLFRIKFRSIDVPLSLQIAEPCEEQTFSPHIAGQSKNNSVHYKNWVKKIGYFFDLTIKKNGYNGTCLRKIF